MPTNHETAESLLRELRHLHDEVEALIRGPRRDQIADQDMVTGREGHALYLIRGGAQSMGQLAAELGIGPAAATGVADRLVELGLAERGRSVDRRVVELQATQRGLGLIRDRNVWEAQAIWALTRALKRVEAGRAEEAISILLQILGKASDHAGGSTGQPSVDGVARGSLLPAAFEEGAARAADTVPSARSD